MPSSDVASDAVRSYLMFLEDPALVVDQHIVNQLEQELLEATDPLDKLRVVSRLERERHGDGDSLRQAFCAHAKTWAEENEVSPSSFLALGVNEEALRDAGFEVGSTSPKERARGGRGRSMARTIDVKAAVEELPLVFTQLDLAQACGASPMTVRKALNELIDEGRIERLGPTPNWSQRGRAPVQFRKLSGRRSGAGRAYAR